MASVVLTGYLYKTDGTAISGATVDVYTHADPPVTLLATTTTSAAGKWTATLTGSDAVSGKSYDVKFTVAGGQYFYIKGSSDYEVGKLHVVSDVYIDTNGHGIYFMDSGNNQVRLIRLHTDDHLRFRAIEDKTIIFEDDGGTSLLTIDEATGKLTSAVSSTSPALTLTQSSSGGALAAVATYKTVTSGSTTSNATAPLGTVVSVRTAEARAAGHGPQIEFTNYSAAAYGGNDYGIIGVIEAADSTGSANLNANMNFYVSNSADNTLLKLLTLNPAQATFSKPTIVPSIGQDSTHQHVLPAVASDTVALVGATQTLVAKTLTSPTINTPTISAPTITGTLTAGGRITATAVGGSAKTLLNFVPVDPGTSYTTTKTGSGNGSGYLTLTGLPSTAVAASLHLKSSSSALVFHVYQDNSGLVGPLTLKPAADGNTVATADMKVTAGGSNQVYYDATGSGSWSFDVNILGYWEPA